MVEITIDYFDLAQICQSGQCFRMTPLSDGSFEIIARNKYLLVYQDGNKVYFDCSQKDFDDFWADYFDIKTDYGAYIARINPRDTYLTEAARQAWGVRILKQDLWEMIVTFLVSQQNNIKRICRCIDLLCTNYGEECAIKEGCQTKEVECAINEECLINEPECMGKGEDDSKTRKTTYYAFPTPEAFAHLEPDALMACNLGYRSKYVVKTAKAVVDGEIDLEKISRLPYRKAKAELMKCYGVGEKVADCICLFALKHFTAFPIDTHIRQVLDTHYKRGFPNRRYKDCRGVMQQYIFYYELHG